MEVHLIRHTQPDVAKGVCYGQTDLGVSGSFVKELEEVKKKLPTSFDALYSSPLRRCRVLSESINENPIFDDRLLEVDFGDWEMKKWDDIPDQEIVPWMNDFVNTAPPNGESLLEMSQRVKAFWINLIQLKGDHIVVITHAGVIRIIKALDQNIPLEKCFEQESTNYGESVVITI